MNFFSQFTQNKFQEIKSLHMIKQKDNLKIIFK